MGGHVDFRSKHCRYEETTSVSARENVPFPASPCSAAPKCKSTGSTWITESETLHCGLCYEEGVTLLPDDTTRIDCPRCGKPERFAPKEATGSKFRFDVDERRLVSAISRNRPAPLPAAQCRIAPERESGLLDQALSSRIGSLSGTGRWTAKPCK